MAVDPELADLDPFALFDAEAARIDAFLATLDDEAWRQPTRCAGWDVHDLTAHLAATEEYHHACLDDALDAFLARGVAAGATDVHSFNDLGVRERADRSGPEIAEEWRHASAQTRRRFRERADGTLTTMVGPYPVRAQAIHLASELAVHADDMGVPISGEDGPSRLAWRTRFARAQLREDKPAVGVDAVDDGTVVRVEGSSALLSDADLVDALNGRLPEDHPLDPAIRAALDSVP